MFIFQSHLARRRDQLRSKMPELSEVAEKDHALLNGHGESNEKLEVMQPPSPNEDPVMPSVPDDFLRKLGLPQDGPGYVQCHVNSASSPYQS